MKFLDEWQRFINDEMNNLKRRVVELEVGNLPPLEPYSEPPKRKHFCSHNLHSNITCESEGIEDSLHLLGFYNNLGRSTSCTVEYCPFCGEKV